MTQAYLLTSEPVVIHLGPSGRVIATSTVPFEVDGMRHAANHQHAINLGRRRQAVFHALGADREGAIKLWPTGR